MAETIDMSFEKYKSEYCSRCDILYELRRRDVIVSKIYEQHVEDLTFSDETELKYEVGAEGVKQVFKGKCTFISQCDEAQELLERLSESEVRLSKLMYWLMQQKREQDVFYISADIDPFYPVLSNRIVRCDLSKIAVLKDKYDVKELSDKFKMNE